jgi:arabinogalactan endo-1,4-beta-galactosidase
VCLRFLCFRPSTFDNMAEGATKDVVQLAEQVAEGFAALSGEYQILFDQQKLLESRLSWAKQQVSHEAYFLVHFSVMKHF